MRHLATAELMLNTSQNVALTTEAQPPSFIQVGDSHMIQVLGHTKSYEWLGCMLRGCSGHDPDVEYHFQQAARAFQKHCWMLQCRSVLSNTGCVISKQLFFQQLASLQNTDFFTENVSQNMINFENLFVAYSLHSGASTGHSAMA